uniref:Ig-like domain-containing protein n=1 Tax=Periophthalmus magnuspinnatus TaxID=409849 RepID=A0A3B3ZXK4_9GOBI
MFSSPVSSQVNLHETSHFLFATVGDSITLTCYYEDKNKVLGAMQYWYKESLGTKPTRISSFSKYYQTKSLHGEFNQSHRFTLDADHENNNLNIKHVQMSDSAVYLCITCFLHNVDIIESVTLIVKSLSPTAEVRQSPHEDTEPGHSVTLNCNVQTESCEGEHRVHWFKQSEESAAGLLYIKGSSSDQCESNTDSPTKSCVYKLPIHNVSSEQTGTYYCAVAACGQVLFGNGTRITIKCEEDPRIYILSGALVFSSLLVLLLALAVCIMKRKLNWLCRTSSNTNAGEQEVNSLHYAALSVHPSSRRQRVTAQTDCVYSSVHPHD